MAKFSERLRLLRKNAGLSQQEFANLLGTVSKSSINMYERGEREPSIETLEGIADFFNVDLDYLLGKTDIPNRSNASHRISFDELKMLTDEFFTKLDVVIGSISIERIILLSIADILGDEIDLSKEDFVTYDNYTSINHRMGDYVESLTSKVMSATLTLDLEERLHSLLELYNEELSIKERLFSLLEKGEKATEILESDTAALPEQTTPSEETKE